MNVLHSYVIYVDKLTRPGSMDSTGAISLLVLFSCAKLCYLEPTMSPFTIGVIMSRSHVTRPEVPTVTQLSANVTVRWYYTDYTELFYVFRQVQLLDANQAIDHILLVDYMPAHRHTLDAIQASNKELIKLTRSPTITQDNREDLKRIIRQWGLSWNDIDDRRSNRVPYCKLRHSLSENASSGEEPMTSSLTTSPPRILANLVAVLKWTTVFVFYENATEVAARLFSDHLPYHRAVFSLHNVDTLVDLYGTLDAMYDSRVRIEHTTVNVVVVCRVGCLLKLLKAANEFDARHKSFQASLVMFSRWLTLVYNYNQLAANLIRTVAENLNNVAVLAVPEMTSITRKMIVSSLWEGIGDQENHTFSSETSWKTHLVEQVNTAVGSLRTTSLCSHYLIDTLLWGKKGREFQTVGYGGFQGRVDVRTDLFPNLNYGYSGRHFKVTTAPLGPYVIKSIVNNTEVYEGVYMDLLTELSRTLNFTYTLMEPPDGMWGSVVRVENGTPIFNGMIGQLQRHEVDFAAVPVTYIPERDMVVDFSHPVSHEYSTVVMRKPNPDADKWKTLLNPFKLEVLYYIGGALLAVTVMTFLVERYGPYYCNPGHAQMRSSQGGLHSLHNAFWYMYGALLCQGGIHLPDSLAGRTLVGFWWLVCIIIVGTYSGNLIAFLTVSRFEPPFNSLREMLEWRDTITWGIWGGTFWETIFTTSQVPIFRAVGDTLIEFNMTDPDTLNPSGQFHIDRVKRGDYAWIADTTSIELMMATECSLFMIKERFLPLKDGFAFQHNSPHVAIFSEQIMKSQEAGLVEIWRRKWLPKLTFCNNVDKPESTPISLLDVQSAFYVCLIGVVVGTVAFVLECLVYRLRRKLGEATGTEHGDTVRRKLGGATGTEHGDTRDDSQDSCADSQAGEVDAT